MVFEGTEGLSYLERVTCLFISFFPQWIGIPTYIAPIDYAIYWKLNPFYECWKYTREHWLWVTWTNLHVRVGITMNLSTRGPVFGSTTVQYPATVQYRQYCTIQFWHASIMPRIMAWRSKKDKPAVPIKWHKNLALLL